MVRGLAKDPSGRAAGCAENPVPGCRTLEGSFSILEEREAPWRGPLVSYHHPVLPAADSLQVGCSVPRFLLREMLGPLLLSAGGTQERALPDTLWDHSALLCVGQQRPYCCDHVGGSIRPTGSALSVGSRWPRCHHY